MKIDVISIFPEMIEQSVRFGVLGQAIKKNLLNIRTTNPRQFANDNHKTVDDRPYGGGDGMIMLADPLCQSVDSVKSKSLDVSTSKSHKIIYLSPQGRPLSQNMVNEISKLDHLILICGRYGGIDERVLLKYSIEEVSIGDYVISGGEPAALVLIDAVARQIPGVLGHEHSAKQDSFTEGLLEAPVFTRPESFSDIKVPEVLLSGHHENILHWRKMASLIVTFIKRRDLFDAYLVKNSVNKSLLALHLSQFIDSMSENDRLILKLSPETINLIKNQL